MTHRLGSFSQVVLATTLAFLFFAGAASAQSLPPAPSPSPSPSPSPQSPTSSQGSGSAFISRTLQAITDNCVALSNSPTPLSGARADLFTQCTDIINASDISEQDAAVLAVIDDENPGVGTNATDASVSQVQALSDRLFALREGSTGIQIAGLGEGTLRYGLDEHSASGSDGGMPRLGAFLNGLGFVGTQDQRGEQAPYDFSGGGVTVGADYRFGDNVVAGLAFGWTRRDSNFDNGSDYQSDSYSPSVYASWFGDAFFVDGIFTYTRTTHDLDRRIRYNVAGTPVIRTASADPNANEYAASVGGGYDFVFDELTVGPRVQVNYLHWDLESFTESGAGGLNLKNRSQDTDSLTSVVGAEASYAHSTEFGVLVPQIRIGWVHEFENDSRRINGFFAVENAAPMNVFTEKPDRDYAALGLSLSGTFAHGWSAFFDYETLLALSDVSLNRFTVGARLEF
jgi:outer membrane autotransporter protein